MNKTLMVGYLAMLLAGCSVTQVNENAQNVRVVFDRPDESRCTHLGEVFGDEGDLISYWFTPNAMLIQGALNDIKNKTAEKGGNLVYISDELGFNTATSFLGLAYQCQFN